MTCKRFLLTPEDWLKLHLPLKTSIKYGCSPWRTWLYIWRISWNLKLRPQKNSVFFYSTPKDILKFCNLVLKNSIGPQPVGKTKPFHFYKFCCERHIWFCNHSPCYLFTYEANMFFNFQMWTSFHLKSDPVFHCFPYKSILFIEACVDEILVHNLKTGGLACQHFSSQFHSQRSK